MSRCELGYCVWVLYYRLWDSPITTPPRMSRKWWKERKHKFLEGTSACEITLNPHTAEPAPFFYEIEMGLD